MVPMASALPSGLLTLGTSQSEDWLSFNKKKKKKKSRAENAQLLYDSKPPSTQ